MSPARDSLGAKQGRQDSRPPLFFVLLRVDPARFDVAGSAGWSVFSDVAARCCERLLLAVLPARRLPMPKLRLECLEPRPMLSESAAVTPLRPVLGVCASFDCEPDRGTLRRERFCPSLAKPLSPVRWVSVDGPCDDGWLGTTVSYERKVPWVAVGEISRGLEGLAHRHAYQRR